jgi:hypothetical protein
MGKGYDTKCIKNGTTTIWQQKAIDGRNAEGAWENLSAKSL